MFEQLLVIGLVFATAWVAALGCGLLQNVKRRRQISLAAVIVLACTSFWFTEKTAIDPNLDRDVASWFRDVHYSGGLIGDNNPYRAKPFPQANPTKLQTPTPANGLTAVAH